MTTNNTITSSSGLKTQAKHDKAREATQSLAMMSPQVFDYIKYRTYQLPFYSSAVSAGFPSPADDYLDKKLDLNEYLVKNPAATFLVRVEGDSMIGAGIHHGDILIVDRSLTPVSGKIVIAVIDGELTVKRLEKKKGKLLLVPENPAYLPIEIAEESDALIWGVVTNVLHAV